MNRGEILSRVERRRAEIEELEVESLKLFGSWARGEGDADSDIDFLVSFRRKSYDNYFALRELLQDILGRRVDLVTTEALKPSLRDAVLEDAIDATPH